MYVYVCLGNKNYPALQFRFCKNVKETNVNINGNKMKWNKMLHRREDEQPLSRISVKSVCSTRRRGVLSVPVTATLSF